MIYRYDLFKEFMMPLEWIKDIPPLSAKSKRISVIFGLYYAIFARLYPPSTAQEGHARKLRFLDRVFFFCFSETPIVL